MNKKENTIYLEKKGKILTMSILYNGRIYASCTDEKYDESIVTLIKMGINTLYTISIIGNEKYEKTLETGDGYKDFPTVPNKIIYPIEIHA